MLRNAVELIRPVSACLVRCCPLLIELRKTKATQINSRCRSLFRFLFLFCLCAALSHYVHPAMTKRGDRGRTSLHRPVNTYTADRQNTGRTRGLGQVASTHTTNNTHPLTTLHRLACWHSRVIISFPSFRCRIESARKWRVVISHVGPQFISRRSWHTPSVSGKSPNKSRSL